jgi:nitrogen fixation protein NifQ
MTAASAVSTKRSQGGIPSYHDLMAHAVDPENPRILAFAGVISESLKVGTWPLIVGLSEEDFGCLMNASFPGLALENGVAGAAPRCADEYEELHALLMEYRAAPVAELNWLCHALATAAMRNNHLWQDMGLPSRNVLSRLMLENFPALAARNVGDMKWKKFFYRQLCERAGVPVCKSPNCADCVDYAICFGREE